MTPVFYMVSYQVRQRQIQREMNEKLEKEITQTISLNPDEIKWVKKEKEIIIEGRLFDVKEIRHESNGKITVTGLYDEEETSLIEHFQKTQQHNGAEKNQLAQLFQLVWFIPENLSGEHQDVLVFKKLFSPKSDKLIASFQEILTPPPQA